MAQEASVAYGLGPIQPIMGVSKPWFFSALAVDRWIKNDIIACTNPINRVDMMSRTGIHALTALTALAELPAGTYAGAADIAQRISAPRNYLGKLLKRLAEVGLLESQKGKGGGFRLARDPATITLYDVIEPIEHVSRWQGCFFGRVQCSDLAPCAVHQRWGKVRDQYLEFLRETTLADLAKYRTGPACGSECTKQDPKSADREPRLPASEDQ